jgi:hypothetical protein
MRRAGHVECMGNSTDAKRVLLGKPEGKRRLGRPKHMREDTIKSNF